jgi:uncharacterized cupredoxin-like copper-binding protein
MRLRTAGSGLVVAAVGGALAVTGAGVAATGATTLKLKADPHGALTYNKTKLSAPAGKVTVTMKNPAGSHTKHGIEIEGHGVEKRGKNVKPGKTSTVTLKLKPGKYEYYCPVDGHKAAGMKGKLTVK